MKKLLTCLLAALLLLASLSALAEVPYAEGLTAEEVAALTQTTVIRDENSPTGYIVAFRYEAPDAQRVRIRGEWNFSDAYHSSTTQATTILPEDWTPDVFPLQNPSWPAFDMEKNDAGIWCYDIPLPSGTWSYRFAVDGVEGAALTDYTDAFVESDPNNRPIEKELGEQTNSQVRVPFDAQKQSQDFSIQLPRTDGQVGTLAYHLYEAEGVEEPTDDPAIAVYTPYGYDAGREEPYKVLYISHGAGVESETSWVNKGSVCNMMDNLIADYGVEPFVLVIINNYAVDFDADNLVDNIVPLVEANYNVSTGREGKAVAGLSMGGTFTVNQITYHPADFGYYGVFSGGYFGTYADGELEDMGIDAEALKDAHIYLAAGSKEFGLLAIQNVSVALNAAGVTGYHSQVFDGGHDWNVWRQCFVDFALNELWK